MSPWGWAGWCDCPPAPWGVVVYVSSVYIPPYPLPSSTGGREEKVGAAPAAAPPIVSTRLSDLTQMEPCPEKQGVGGFIGPLV